MKRSLFLIILLLMGKVYSSYTFMIEPSISFLYTYDRNSSIVSNISVTIDKFYIDFVGSPSVYLPPEIQKENGNYSYEDLQGNLVKAEIDSKAITIFCKEECLGRIQKEHQSSNGAKFTLYDQFGKPIALAYLDKALWHLMIVDIHDKTSRIAYLHKYHQTYLQGMNQSLYYGWKVEVWQEKMIDPAVLIMFASFLGDTYWDELKRPIGKPHWNFE